MNNLDPRLTSFISGIVAILVPIANQSFGWHLTTGTVLALVGALLGLGALEVGHAHNKALQPGAFLPELMKALEVVPGLVEEITKRTNRPVDSGIKAAGDMARGVTVQDVQQP